MSQDAINTIQRNNPNLWSFFADEEAYAQDSREDLSCRRWQDTLVLADFISLRSESRYFCKPGEMYTTGEISYRNHDSEEGSDSLLRQAAKLSREEYDALRAEGEAYLNNGGDYLWFEFERIFYLKSQAHILEEDYLPIRAVSHRGAYRHSLGVLARVKGIDGYFLFEFYEG